MCRRTRGDFRPTVGARPPASSLRLCLHASFASQSLGAFARVSPMPMLPYKNLTDIPFR
jgi:hypothetical protein